MKSFGLTAAPKVSLPELHSLMISFNALPVCEAGRNSLRNSPDGLFRQFDTTLSVSICLKHQLVPRVMMTLLHSQKKSLALSRAAFASEMNSSAEVLAKDVW